MTIMPPSPFLSSAPASLHPDVVAGSVAALVTPRCDAATEANSCGIPEVRRENTGNMPGSVPGEEMSSAATSFERPAVQGAATQPCAEVTLGPQEDRFVLDEISFLEAIEQMPLFLQYRSVGYMR